MRTILSVYFEKSIKRLIMASFVFVLLLPIGFFGYSLFQNSWQQVEQRMVEKHHLISEALIEPFTLFFSTRQETLHTLGRELLRLEVGDRLQNIVGSPGIDNRGLEAQSILDKHLNSFGDFVVLTYVDTADTTVEWITKFDAENPGLQEPDYSALTLVKLPALHENKPGDFFSFPGI